MQLARSTRPHTGGTAAQRRSISRTTRSCRVQAFSSGAAPRRQASQATRVRVIPAAKRRDSSSTGGGAGEEFDLAAAEAARKAEGGIDRLADSAEAAISDAAAAASGAVSDASDAAAALVQDTAAAASELVDDASAALESAAQAASDLAADAAGATAALAGDAAAAAAELQGAVAAAIDPSAPIDWTLPPGGLQRDRRFAGMKVLVVGATGGTGRRVVQALRARGVPCRALVRDRARAANLLPPPSSVAAAAALTSSAPAPPAPPEFDIAVGDVYQYATLPPALDGCTAVIVASGANDKADPLGPFNVDYNGNLNLIAAAQAAKVKAFVLVTSIGADDIANPLNLFWGILFWKKRAEEALQRSGLRHTIVRPGGLKSRLAPRERMAGAVVMARPGTYGFPPLQQSGSILRSQVAEVCVEALVAPGAAGKVVEVIAERDAPEVPLGQLFDSVRMVAW